MTQRRNAQFDLAVMHNTAAAGKISQLRNARKFIALVGVRLSDTVPSLADEVIE
jgi:hypothetical protein